MSRNFLINHFKQDRGELMALESVERTEKVIWLMQMTGMKKSQLSFSRKKRLPLQRNTGISSITFVSKRWTVMNQTSVVSWRKWVSCGAVKWSPRKCMKCFQECLPSRGWKLVVALCLPVKAVIDLTPLYGCMSEVMLKSWPSTTIVIVTNQR